MSDPSNAGPYEVGVEGTFSAGETKEIRFSEVAAGPKGRKGYLEKLYGSVGGMDYVFVVNTSDQLIRLQTRGGTTFIPPATSQNLGNGPYRSVTVTNEGSTDINTGSNDAVSIETGNGNRDTGEEPKFSARKAVNDVIPGVNL